MKALLILVLVFGLYGCFGCEDDRAKLRGYERCAADPHCPKDDYFYVWHERKKLAVEQCTGDAP